MIWPLEPETCASSPTGLEEILVVEEKRPVPRDVAQGRPLRPAGAPRVVGKRDERGAPLLPAEPRLDADLVARAVAARLRGGSSCRPSRPRVAALDASQRRPRRCRWPRARPSSAPAARTTAPREAPEGTLVGAGIGCHTMVLLNPEGKGEITGITQMGGEGAQWIGMAPFTETEHLVQNIGDGTLPPLRLARRSAPPWPPA